MHGCVHTYVHAGTDIRTHAHARDIYTVLISYFLFLSSYFLVVSSYFLVFTSLFLVLTS